MAGVKAEQVKRMPSAPFRAAKVARVADALGDPRGQAALARQLAGEPVVEEVRQLLAGPVLGEGVEHGLNGHRHRVDERDPVHDVSWALRDWTCGITGADGNT
jgi:hypothetical protein